MQKNEYFPQIVGPEKLQNRQNHQNRAYFQYFLQLSQTQRVHQKPKAAGSKNDFYKKVAYGSIRFLNCKQELVSKTLCKNFVRFSFRATVCPENHFLTLQLGGAGGQNAITAAVWPILVRIEICLGLRQSEFNFQADENVQGRI